MPKLRLAVIGLMVAIFGSQSFAANYKPGEVIVKYRSDMMRTNDVMNDLYDSVGVEGVQYYSGMMHNFEQLFLSKDADVMQAVAQLNQSDLVEYAQPNYLLYLPKKVADDPMPGVPCIPGFDIPNCDPNAPIPCIIPGIPFPPGCVDPGQPGNPGRPPSERPVVQDPPAEVNPPVADPDIAKAWGIGKIGAPEAWNTQKGSKAIVVGVIDTGIDYNHEDLSFNMWRNPNSQDEPVGYDFVHNDGLPFDDQGHGTHVSGTIGAVGGNGKAIAGVTQRVSLMALKFLTSAGSGSTADAVRAIDYAVEHGARVLNNSWGGRGADANSALYDAIERAKEAGVLFVAAAGNDGYNNDGSNPSYPAAFDNENLIAVAATDQSDSLASFSNYGKVTTDLAAPGVNIYSSKPGNSYQAHSGTSMACPHVVGAAALVWSEHPEWDYKQVRDALFNSVDKLDSLTNKTVTGGRLNVLKALN